MLLDINRTITKKDLLYEANIVKEKFNSANFKSKSSGSVQKINKVEVVEKGMAVYFWCSNMNNFVVCVGTKKQTYDRLLDMFMYICLRANNNYIYLSEFTVR